MEQVTKNVTLAIDGDSFIFRAKRSDGPTIEETWRIAVEDEADQLEVWRAWAEEGCDPGD